MSKSSKKPAMQRCIEICASDNRMDSRDVDCEEWDDIDSVPVNRLPQKCRTCGFPDLDHIPDPYFLIKSRTIAPDELALAAHGNLLIRPRIRRVLDLRVPGQCSFYATRYKGTSAKTPWILAVPNNQVVTAKVKKSIPCCKTCKQPRSAHPGSQYSETLFGKTIRGRQVYAQSKHDILKSATWASSENGWMHWLDRPLFMSVRLLHLLKKIKAKGFFEATCDKPTLPDEAESAWVEEQIRFPAKKGVPRQPEGALSDEDAKWLRDYIKTRTAKKSPAVNVPALEKKLKFKLPKSYLDFVRKVGPKSFSNVDEEEGFTVDILMPNKLDIQEYRAGVLETEDEESQRVDGVMFAACKHGDCFCFDIQKGKKEYPVFHYKHEYNMFEPYADNFAACLKRFAGM